LSKKLRTWQGYSREIRIVMAKLPPFELSKGKFLVGDMGAVVVEFAITLVFLFFFFIAFIQILSIFMAHERLSFACFVASRVYSVQGRTQAINTANTIETGLSIKIKEDGGYESKVIKSRTITLEKKIDVPIDFRNIFSKTGTKFAISKGVKTFREVDPGGDN
jgi:hypothetical protein